jgi:hypothetical protein
VSYSVNKPFKDREHIIWEIERCSRAANYLIVISLVTFVLGIASDLLNMKLLLGATSWLLIAVFGGIISLAPHLHLVLAKHLLGMEVIKKEKE